MIERRRTVADWMLWRPTRTSIGLSIQSREPAPKDPEAQISCPLSFLVWPHEAHHVPVDADEAQGELVDNLRIVDSDLKSGGGA